MPHVGPHKFRYWKFSKQNETTAGSKKLWISKFWGDICRVNYSIYTPALKKETRKELVLSEYKELQAPNSEECS
jgi:hypothetical protein